MVLAAKKFRDVAEKNKKSVEERAKRMDEGVFTSTSGQKVERLFFEEEEQSDE